MRGGSSTLVEGSVVESWEREVERVDGVSLGWVEEEEEGPEMEERRRDLRPMVRRCR